MRNAILGAVAAVMLLAVPARAEVSLYDGPGLQRELDKARGNPEWRALDSWLMAQGYVRDGGEVGGKEKGNSNLSVSYTNPGLQRNAILAREESSKGQKLYHAMIFGRAADGSMITLDYYYDPAMGTAREGDRTYKRNFAYEWAGCMLGAAAGSAVGCAIGSAMFAEVTFAPCFAAGVLGGGVVGCGVSVALNWFYSN